MAEFLGWLLLSEGDPEGSGDRVKIHLAEDALSLELLFGDEPTRRYPLDSVVATLLPSGDVRLGLFADADDPGLAGNVGRFGWGRELFFRADDPSGFARALGISESAEASDDYATADQWVADDAMEHAAGPALAQPPPTEAPIGAYPYRSARMRARWAQALIGLVGVATLVGIWATWGEIQLLEQVQDGGFVTPAEATASDNRVVAAGLLYLLVFFPAVVVYLVWIHRSVQNLSQVRSGDGYHLQFTPGWAVGWYFVPIMNLFRPFQVMRELYTESNPENRSSPLVGWWWGLWLAGGFVGPSLINLFSDPSLSEAIVSDYRTVAADLVLLVDAVLVILLMERIVKWQDSQAEQLGLSGIFR